MCQFAYLVFIFDLRLILVDLFMYGGRDMRCAGLSSPDRWCESAWRRCDAYGIEGSRPYLVVDLFR